MDSRRADKKGKTKNNKETNDGRTEGCWADLGHSSKESPRRGELAKQHWFCFFQLLEQDKLKFDAADVNKDGSMSVKEYAAFMHPYDFEHMHDIEIDMTLQAIDKNKDGKLSLKEFVGEGE